jgi:hypothetical protein
VGASVLVTTPDDEEIHQLAGGASVVWEQLAETRGVEDMVAAIGKATSLAADELRAQVQGCVEDLVRIRVVEASV